MRRGKKSNFVLNADDAKLYKPLNSINDCLEMSEDLLSIEKWIEKWQMLLNISGCELLRIGYNSLEFPYRVASLGTNDKVSCRYLGVNMFNDLSFSHHC